MHTYLIAALLLCSLSCQNRSTEQSASQSADTTSSTLADASAAPDTLCFRQIMGRDTTTARLFVNGEQASGYLAINRYEKDRAQGPFSGKVYPDHIRADWQRSGEGVTDTYALDMVRQGDTLSWREGEFIKNPNGKGWILKEPNKGYQNILIKIDCPPASPR
jgi:hypothetical protein